METFLIRDLWYNMYTDSDMVNLSFGQVSGVSPAGCSMSNKVQSTWIGNARKTEAMQRLYAGL